METELEKRQLSFVATITKKTKVRFTLKMLVDPDPLFSIRELVIPWLREGNVPEVMEWEHE